MTPDRLFLIVGSVIAVLLQILVAPYIAVFAAVPNFIVAFIMATSIARPQTIGVVAPFVCGLVFDLVGGGPVGAMAFTLTLVSYLITRFFMHATNDSPVMAIAFVALGVLLVEVVYGVFLLAFGFNATLFEALAYRIVPCFIYDLILGLIVYVIALRFGEPKAAVRTDITQLR